VLALTPAGPVSPTPRLFLYAATRALASSPEALHGQPLVMRELLEAVALTRAERR
jgi:hypothetical protein